MLDPLLLRNELTTIQKQLHTKGFVFDLDSYKSLEQTRKEAQSKAEELQAKRNALAKEIGKRKAQNLDVSDLMSTSQILSEATKEAESSQKECKAKLEAFLAGIPNLPASSVPIGKNEDDNVEIARSEQQPKKFSFPAKDHMALTGGCIDTESGALLCGSRFAFMHGPLAKLHRVLAQWMLDLHTQSHGYTEVNVPVMVKPQTLFGTGQLPKFRDDQFITQTASELTLIPTAEVPLTNLVAERILNADTLPLQYCAHSLCFRKEAGSYGKDTTGIFRVHQFEKVELVHICSEAQAEDTFHRLVTHAETVLKSLRLPYRIVNLCTGDLGFSAQKTYDLEVWLPSQNTYREVSSCSHMGDFQARRMMTRIKNPENPKQKAYAHTLNGSGLAVGRTLIAILENYQQADGSIAIPKILQAAMQCEQIGPF